MKGIVKGSRRLFVRSWREGQRVERLAVDLDDFDRFREGDAVVVGVGPGALGIPWYYGVDRRWRNSPTKQLSNRKAIYNPPPSFSLYFLSPLFLLPPFFSF